MSDYAERSLRLLLWYLEIKNLAWLAFNFLRFLIQLDASLRIGRTALGQQVVQDVAVSLLLIASFALPVLKAEYLHVEVSRLLLRVTTSVN